MLDAAADNSKEIHDLLCECLPAEAFAGFTRILRVDPQTAALVWKHRAEVQPRLDQWLSQRDAKGADQSTDRAR